MKKVPAFNTLSQEQVRRKRYKVPYVFNIKNNEHTAVFIGINHTNSLNDTTIKAIDKEYKKLSLDGSSILFCGEISIPSNVLVDRRSLVKNYRESGYLYFLAKKTKGAYVCVTPTTNELFQQILLKKQYSKKDLAGWVFLNVLNSALKGNGKVKDINNINSVFTYISKTFRIRSFSALANHINNVLETEFLPLSIDKLDKQTINQKYANKIQSSKGDVSIFNKISREINDLNDILMVKNIFNFYSQKNNVIVVLGHNHVVAQEPALKKVLS